MNLFQKIKPALFLATVFVLGAAPQLVFALTHDKIAGALDAVMQDIFRKLILTIGAVIQFLGALLISVTGFVLDLMLRWNFLITDTDFNQVTSVGWQITRDVANLGFVLALIIIAFATILRFRQYGAKKMLVKLIAAALLVNFSFAIAAGFINFSNGIADVFLDRAGGASEMSAAIMSAIGPQNILIGDTTDADELENRVYEEEFLLDSLADGISGLVQFFSTILFSVIFLLLTALVLAGFGFMLLIRYVYLSILIILAPMAWLFWVLPRLEGHFSAWWNKFLKWTFFAPTVAFFIYLSIVSARLLGEGGAGWQEITASPISAGLPNILAEQLQYGVRVTILAGLMLGGLFAAESMGIKGAGATINLADKGKNLLGGAALQGARRARDATLAGGKDTEGRTLAERAAESQVGKNIPLLRGVAGAARRAKERQEERTKEHEEKVAKTRTGKMAAQRFEQRGGPMTARAIAEGLHAAREGHFDELSDNKQQKLIKALQKQGRENELLPYAPNHAAEIKSIKRDDYDTEKEYRDAAKRAKEEAINKMPPLTDFSPEMQQRITNDIDSTVNMPIPRLDEAGKEAPSHLKENIHSTLQDVAGDIFDEIKGLEKEIDKAKQRMSDAANEGRKDDARKARKDRDAAIAKLKGVRSSLKSPENKRERKAVSRLERIYDNQSEYWMDTTGGS